MIHGDHAWLFNMDSQTRHRTEVLHRNYADMMWVIVLIFFNYIFYYNYRNQIDKILQN